MENYINEILKKFNEDQNHPELNDTEKTLLKKMLEVNSVVLETIEKINQLNKEIDERKRHGDELVQQVIKLQGQSQGILDSLLLLKSK